ncbi:hypothetical protein DICPUDRAFT_97813 [Dictyostelium purpureum]|uniref:Uncharacterized protein n=1 Tax=Dictyostelium purpureum TaxID=5786 RepID=F0ZJZ8_DICPU|nr:uncharacterized protein DICPUDRAFT_97813 [Dictyostelium purpureum]EGC35745.1 hypothetical protein DICPUDRAFT_97813 [Dictyostelium purpureum]|eukprot:XP_003287748.1 hypothetical protein DICPUDRAFT_97813 [Dictyostelium purpureum]
MTKRTSIEAINKNNYSSIDDIKKSFQSNMETLLEKDSNAENSYKRKYINLKESVGTIKKLRFTETEQLFEEFKIKAEQRDSDARKLINKIKRELDNYKTSNKVLKETLNSNHGFDCETIRKDILLRVEDDHKFSISQLKLNYDEKMSQLESSSNQMIVERDQNKEKITQLELEIEKLKQQNQEQQEKEKLEKDQLEKEFQDKIIQEKEKLEKEYQQQQQQQQKEKEQQDQQDQKEKQKIQDISLIIKNNEQIDQYYKDIIQELKLKFEEESKNNNLKFEQIIKKSEEKLAESSKLILKLETEKTDLLGKFQMLSNKFQEKSNNHKELLMQFEELKQNIINEREEFNNIKNKEIEQLNKKLQDKSNELQELKESTEQSKIELQKEFEDIQAKFDENLMEQLKKKDQELEDQIKKHNEEIEELEERLEKSNDDSLPTVENLLNQLKDQKLELDSLISKNTTSLKYIELFEIFTHLKIIQVTDTTYELICQNQSNNAKIHLKFSIEEDGSYSCSTISIDNCKDENNMFSEEIIFTKEDASGFLVNMLSIILNDQ